jgi:serine/threonine-protein kinase
MGLVYGARHRATGRAVAIKVLRAELVSQRGFLHRLSSEARLAVEGSHPNVVEVIDIGMDERGIPYLVLERLFGHTLEALLHRALPLLATMEALIPIMNALAVLHRAGIVHRDIKPSNVFLSCDGGRRITPKLLDFGIAKALEGSRSTSSGSALGTPAYMAPEQALGFGALGPQADVWSMGVVLVHCLTGELPFELKPATHLGALLSGLQRGDLPGVPEPVAVVLTNALRLDPQARFSDMAEFRNALLDALRDSDATRVWPCESSVSYARATSEVEGCLRALDQRGGGKAPGRDPQVMTRTLSSLLDLPSRYVRRRGLATSVACGVLAVAILPSMVWWGRTERQSAANEPVHAATSAVSAAAPVATRELSRVEHGSRPAQAGAAPPDAEEPSPPERAPTVTRDDRRRQPVPIPRAEPRTSVVRHRSQSAPPARAAGARIMTLPAPSQPPQRRLSRSANRSPIID